MEGSQTAGSRGGGARRHLDRGLQIDPRNPVAHRILAEFGRLGRLDEAYPEARGYSPRDVQVYLALGVARDEQS